MVSVFSVYTRHTTKGVEQWGLETSGTRRRALRIAAGKILEDKQIALGALGPSIASWTRTGFKCEDGGRFFDEKSCGFHESHPDFLDAADYVAFSEPGDLTQAVVDLERVLVPAASRCGVPADAVRRWLSAQDQHEQYLVAPPSHPVFTLAICEQAINSGWALFGRTPDHPESAPSAVPLDWVQWLSSSFAAIQIHEAQRALGGGIASQLAKPIPAPQGAPASYYI